MPAVAALALAGFTSVVAGAAPPVCVPLTTLCAPAGSTLKGSVQAPSGGAVELVPVDVLTLGGVRFRGGAPLRVQVLPWWRGGSADAAPTSGAIVHVDGELDGAQTIGGVPFSGRVTVASVDGASYTLVSGRTSAAASGRIVGVDVELAAGAQLTGFVDIARARVDIDADGVVSVDGLRFRNAGAGARTRVSVEVRDRDTSAAELITWGTLAEPQRHGDVRVSGDVELRRRGAVARAANATLVDDTPLAALGLPELRGDTPLPDGTAPAGARVVSRPDGTWIQSPATVDVCGVPLAGHAGGGAWPAGVSFVPVREGVVEVRGLVGPTTSVGPLRARISGSVALSLGSTGCTWVGVEGKLASELSVSSSAASPRFRADKPFAWQRSPQDGEVVWGTLSAPIDVAGWRLAAREARVVVVDGVGTRVLDGTLAAPAELAAWRLPTGTRVQQWPTGFQFNAPRGASARAIAALPGGLRADHVREARRDDDAFTLSLAAPVIVGGVPMAELHVDPSGGVSGSAARAVRVGPLAIPASADVDVCGGDVVRVAVFAVPAVRIGRVYATDVVRWPRSGSLPPSGPTCPAEVSTDFAAQVLSLCQGPSGIPQPPPAQRWVHLDAKGALLDDANDPLTAVERARIERPGKPCPTARCCVP